MIVLVTWGVSIMGIVGQGLSVEVNPVSGALFAAWYTYEPRRGRRGARPKLVYGASQLYGRDAFDPGDDPRNHRWDIQHADAFWPTEDDRADRGSLLPELHGGDV
jgi:hypothetical protein